VSYPSWLQKCCYNGRRIAPKSQWNKPKRRKILVVDDEPTFVKLISQTLTHKGYEVLTAGDGQEALRLLFANKPDLVLLDVKMPKMDGWQTCSRIRELSDVPIVMLTGKQKSEEDIVRGLDYGADDYLIKPVEVESW